MDRGVSGNIAWMDDSDRVVDCVGGEDGDDDDEDDDGGGEDSWPGPGLSWGDMEFMLSIPESDSVSIKSQPLI